MIQLILVLVLIVTNSYAYVIYPGVPMPKMNFNNRFPAKDTGKDLDEEVRNFVELSFFQLQRTLLVEKDIDKKIKDFRFLRNEVLDYQVRLVVTGIKSSGSLSLADKWYPYLGLLDIIFKYWLERYEYVKNNSEYMLMLQVDLGDIRVLHKITDIELEREKEGYVKTYALLKELVSRGKSTIDLMSRQDMWAIKGKIDNLSMLIDDFFAKSLLRIIFILNLKDRYDVDEQLDKIFSLAKIMYNLKKEMVYKCVDKFNALQKKK